MLLFSLYLTETGLSYSVACNKKATACITSRPMHRAKHQVSHANSCWGNFICMHSKTLTHTTIHQHSYTNVFTLSDIPFWLAENQWHNPSAYTMHTSTFSGFAVLTLGGSFICNYLVELIWDVTVLGSAIYEKTWSRPIILSIVTERNRLS